MFTPSTPNFFLACNKDVYLYFLAVRSLRIASSAQRAISGRPETAELRHQLERSSAIPR